MAMPIDNTLTFHRLDYYKVTSVANLRSFFFFEISIRTIYVINTESCSCLQIDSMPSLRLMKKDKVFRKALLVY